MYSKIILSFSRIYGFRTLQENYFAAPHCIIQSVITHGIGLIEDCKVLTFSDMSNHRVKKYERREELSSFGLVPGSKTVAIWSSESTQQNSVLPRNSLDMKGMPQLDERRTGKAPLGTS